MVTWGALRQGEAGDVWTRLGWRDALSKAGDFWLIGVRMGQVASGKAGEGYVRGSHPWRSRTRAAQAKPR